MKPDEACRSFAESRGDLLRHLGKLICPDSGSIRLLDPAGGFVWSSSDVVSADDAATVKVDLGGYGSLQIAPAAAARAEPHVEAWTKALGELLTLGMESEAEFNDLADDHIATTNQLLALYQIINRTRDTWELPAKMEAIIAEAARQTTAGQATLLLSDERWPLRIHRGPEGSSREAAITLLDALRSDERPRIDPAGRYVIAPIRSRDRIAGSLLVTDPPASGYKAKDLKLVQALSELAAGFLSTAHLQEQVIANLRLEQEIEIASRIQALLLSRRMPECPGLDLTAACRPAFHVGGDFYAAERAPGGDLFFAFGDVAGKGVPAALFMAMTRTVLMTLGREEVDPMAILRRVNDVLYDDLEQAGKFVTLVVGRYSPGDGRIELANAGHSPVIVLPDRHGEPILMTPHLPPLGVIPAFEEASVSLPLGPGGLLAVMSDGLSEARSPAGEFFGTTRLQELLRAGASGAVAALAESVFSEVESFSDGAPRADDQTLLLLQRRGDA